MDCPVCASAKGLKEREELLEHMNLHKNNPDLLIEKFADYVAARELFRHRFVAVLSESPVEPTRRSQRRKGCLDSNMTSKSGTSIALYVLHV